MEPLALILRLVPVLRLLDQLHDLLRPLAGLLQPLVHLVVMFDNVKVIDVHRLKPLGGVRMRLGLQGLLD